MSREISELVATKYCQWLYFSTLSEKLHLRTAWSEKKKNKFIYQFPSPVTQHSHHEVLIPLQFWAARFWALKQGPLVSPILVLTEKPRWEMRGACMGTRLGSGRVSLEEVVVLVAMVEFETRDRRG